LKHILLLGAGKSATALIEYLIANAAVENWHITIADAQLHLIEEKTRGAGCTTAFALEVQDTAARQALVSQTDVVISLLPPALHLLVAQDCIQLRKHLLTASYADEGMKALANEAAAKGILFLCEMGLDPGIDHMSAVQLIDNIKAEGGHITSFYSHCGGLVAPESDNNPWHYKISWNPRNVVMAGKSGAVYRLNGITIQEGYEELFTKLDFLEGEDIGHWCWYPNRDSLSYLPLYGLDDCHTFVRTTLRKMEFMYGWSNLISLRLTDENLMYDTDGLSIAGFLRQHFIKHNFSSWITTKLSSQFTSLNSTLDKTIQLLKKEQEMQEDAGEGEEVDENFLMVDDDGNLKDVNLEEEKQQAAGSIAARLYESNMMIQQLFFLGMQDEETLIDKGRCSAADVLQFILEKKLPLLPEDKDLVLMVHELEYEKEGATFYKRAVLMLEGEDGTHTAMAKTVGLPLGIAARLILNGQIQLTGLQIPVIKEIYQPVLRELAAAGIEFTETTEVRK
jgi:saccharopine dehydrogenase-like NADP-dependent oxidoreductase